MNKQKLSTEEYLARIYQSALKLNASDIHIEPQSTNFRIRFRVDGLLQHHEILSNNLASKLINSIKISAKLDIAENRLPQDGSISFKNNNKELRDFSLRISTCPCVFGEKIVLRILTSQTDIVEINSIGFSKKQLEIIKEAINNPSGLILLAGPTGSGKTTTIYSIIQELNIQEKNIVSIEDPVEISINGITQVNVNESIGITFTSATKSFMRQDPNIIIIGEIRDAKTAKAALNAAQTGHLVISTIHAKDNLQVLLRLINFNLDLESLLQSLSLIISQRLLRKVDVNKPQEYKGVIPVFSLMYINSKAKKHIKNKEYEKIPNERLYNQALKLVDNKLTTFPEVKRVIKEDDY